MTEKKRCTICNREFNASRAKRVLDHRYGRGMYHRVFLHRDACQSCAEVDIHYVLFGPPKDTMPWPEEDWGSSAGR